jgi:CO dehydrogenase/acetyl-CoA synthase delta subunit
MIINYLQIGDMKVPVVSTQLDGKDHLGALKVRWLIGRDNYKIEPGLYAVGKPDDKSDVFVSANYKLSFDDLRKNLDGLNAWILVLDTKGVNVWCAAGKGTFGTKELVNRILLSGLDKVVSHRKLIVPQLGATGVSAYQVKELTKAISTNSSAGNCGCGSQNNIPKAEGFSLKMNHGFEVIFGPVRASDIKEFINNGYKSTPEMRRVSFNLSDRIKLTSVDIVYARYKLLVAFALIFIISGLNRSGIDFKLAYNVGFTAITNIFLAYLAGIVVTPILLPYIPVKMFAFKGMICGIILSLVLFYFNKLGHNYFEIGSWFLLISGISSFMTMNFTGASTYTSLSGVKKEMKIAVPVQISFAVIGLVLLVIGKLV